MYTVQRGDTLRRIAAQFGISVDALVRANRDVSNPNQIRVGQRLRIPNRRDDTGGWGGNSGGWGGNSSVYTPSEDDLRGIGDERDDYSSGTSQDPDVSWLRLAYEEEQAGVAEYTGRYESNPRIVEYHRSTTLPANYANSDKTAWCASFVNWCLRETGHDTLDSAFALDWRGYGERLSRPEFGCVAVFQEGKNRHVGFYIEGQPGNVLTLGGNQSDRVCVQLYRYPVVAFRWPTARASRYDARTRSASPLEFLRNAVKPKTERRDCRELLDGDLNGGQCSRHKLAEVRQKLSRL